MSNPIKPSFKTEWFSGALIILGFLAAFYFFQHFPNLVPSHWNFKGEVDGYSSAFLAAFALPVMMLVLYLVFIFIPYLDPKKDQYESFAKVYHHFKDLIVAFLFILFMLTGLNGLGYRINVGFWSPIMIGALFILIGALLEKVKMNWFLGIRTPWTLSSEIVWQKTHRVSSWVLMFAGLLLAATVFFAPLIKIILFSLAIFLIVFGLPVYSYILYVREKKAKKQ